MDVTDPAAQEPTPPGRADGPRPAAADATPADRPLGTGDLLLAAMALALDGLHRRLPAPAGPAPDGEGGPRAALA